MSAHSEFHRDWLSVLLLFELMYAVHTYSMAMLQGSCPNCGSANSTYFGDILTVKGNREKNEVQCGDCKAKLQFDSNKREVSISNSTPCYLLRTTAAAA